MKSFAKLKWDPGTMRIAVMAILLLLSSCCRRIVTQVKEMPEPEYPLRARIDNTQGTVQLGVQIGFGGKVLWVHGAGAPPILVEAAEQNARRWVFGPFPPKTVFPVYHEITFVYKLRGSAISGILGPPTVMTDLPDRVEIIAVPVRGDLEMRVTPSATPEERRGPVPR